MADEKIPGSPLTPVDFDPFAATAVSDVLPLTEPQTEIWAAVQMGSDASCAYNQCYSLKLRGALSAESMQNALRQVMDRHDALRVSIDAETQHQLILGSSEVVLPVIDLSGHSPDSRTAEIERLLNIETTQPFDLSAGPLVRAKLIREAADVHRLIVTAHHIVCDGWSSAVLFGDLARIYAADRHGLPAELPVASCYRDYVTREAVRVDDAQARADADYWAQQYADSIPVLDLPLDAARPGVKTYSGARQEMRLDESLCHALKAAGAKHGCTLFVTLLAGFEALLSRLSGQEDFVVGVSMAGQTLLDNGHLVGHCVNLMPLRCRIEPAARFVDHLKSVRHAFLDTQSHQQVSFGSLVRQLSVPRDPSRTPLVSITFNIDKVGAPFNFGDVMLEAVESPPKRFVNFEIAINVVTRARDLVVECEYNTDLFNAATIRRWLGHYIVLLEASVANPEQRVDELPLLSASERHQLLVEWNDSAADYPADALLHRLFEAQAQRAPERIAVVHEHRQLTYGELNAKANRLARVLRARGVGRGQRVGLCVERGAEMLAAVLGILKAGAAYVPLDPAFPEERLRFMAEDAELALLVSTTDLVHSFALPGERQVLLDADDQSIDAAPDIVLPIDAHCAQPEDPAYVIYTSGSSGKPKGVVVPHRAVVNFLTSMASEPGLTADDVLMAVTTLSFDIAVLELQLPLTLGAKVVIASRDEAVDGHALSSLLEEYRATVMQATPVTWRLLLEEGWKRGQHENFKALVGGEALPRELAGQLITGGVELWNMYGPTETTVWSTCAHITDIANGISIGKPIANTTVYILDGQENLCPIGVPGEMYIGGAGVTLGYWNRPELTAERFIPDPFSATPGATLYRTGDRARWRNDGTLEHLGRLDDQVKMRGFRIELAEIEAVLAEHPDVHQAAVHLWTAKANDVRLVACCVSAKARVLAPISLRKHLRARLPEYMIPQNFLPVDEIPLTPNGKIDRRRLPAPVVTGDRFQPHEAPSDPIEATIAEIWTDLIGPARSIGRADKFFEMGGHSLLAIQALRQIENKFGVRLNFSLFFQESLAEIATKCRLEPACDRVGGEAVTAPSANIF